MTTPHQPQPHTDGIPDDIMRAAEDALDNLLCNCVESCGGYDGVRKASIEDIAKAILDERHRHTDGWQPIETAPKDVPIIGWCVHEADLYHDESTGRLTDYGCYCEAVGRVADGAHILVWGGYDSDYDEWSGRTIVWPDWWFRFGSEFEETANPTHWMPLPNPPSTTQSRGGDTDNG